MPVTIEVSNLTKDFGEIVAVSDLSFKARSGEIIALLGPNGAGKSTLMNMITGYLAPTSGSIKVMEKDISGTPLEAKKLIGFLPEGSPLYPDMSVRSFLEYMAELRGFSGNEKKQRLQEIARAANIADILSQKSKRSQKDTSAGSALPKALFPIRRFFFWTNLPTALTLTKKNTSAS